VAKVDKVLDTERRLRGAGVAAVAAVGGGGGGGRSIADAEQEPEQVEDYRWASGSDDGKRRASRQHGGQETHRRPRLGAGGLALPVAGGVASAQGQQDGEEHKHGRNGAEGEEDERDDQEDAARDLVRLPLEEGQRRGLVVERPGDEVAA